MKTPSKNTESIQSMIRLNLQMMQLTGFNFPISLRTFATMIRTKVDSPIFR
jgi:hypothetical protein